MAWFEHNTSRIYYEEDGSGDSVLLLPGWAGSIQEFPLLREALTPNFRVIAADLLGSGRSGPQPRDYTRSYYEDDARSFLALLDHLALSPSHVIGFSDGGEDALLMAVLRPSSVRSVVTWGAAGQIVDPQGMLDAFYDLIDNPIPPLQAFAEYLQGTYGEANARAMTHSFVQALRAIIEGGGDISRSRAADISCPSLLMTGEHDFICPPALVADLATAIGDSEFVEVKDADHAVHIARPEWLVETIVGWLGRQ